MRILGVSGSLQARSGNRALLETARASVPLGVEMTLFEDLRAIPPFDPETEATEAVIAWRRALAESEAVIVASPEYGFSLPGALKNAIDWTIGSGELEGKVVGVTAAVNVEGRGKRGLEALCDTLRAVSARIVGGTPIVRGASFERDVATLVEAVVAEARAPEHAPEHGMGMLRPAALVAAWVGAFNRSDSEALAALHAKGVVSSGPPGEPPITVEKVFEDGDWAILEWRKAGGVRGCLLLQVKRGLIVAQRSYGETRRPDGS